MLLYATLGTNDLHRAIAFYDPVMQLLGHDRLPAWSDGWAGWGKDYENGFGLWVCPAWDGAAATPGNGTMLAFPARDAAEVRAFYSTALAHGGSDDGAPGTRPYYDPDFYVAYVRDPDGHKLACVFAGYDPALDAR